MLICCIIMNIMALLGILEDKKSSPALGRATCGFVLSCKIRVR